MKTIPRELRTLFETGALGNLADGQLLGRFVARRDEAAFGCLVHRHGPMVWGVCVRVLRDAHDAEDAFQATFLVLARKGAAIAHRETLAGWLYRAAHLTARKARTARERRKSRETQVHDLPDTPAPPRPPLDDLIPLLDRELSRLGDRYRLPIILCDLEGKSQRDAAEALGWPIGTVSGRLTRGRVLLARRLSRQGLALAGGTLALALAEQAAAASPPARLIPITGRSVVNGEVPATVQSLAQGVAKTMMLSKLGGAAGGILLVAALTNGLAGALPSAGPANEGPKPAGKAETPGPDGARGRKTGPLPIDQTRTSVRTIQLQLLALRDTLKAEIGELEGEWLRLRHLGVAAGDPRIVPVKKRLAERVSDYNAVLDSLKALQRVHDRVLAR